MPDFAQQSRSKKSELVCLLPLSPPTGHALCRTLTLLWGMNMLIRLGKLTIEATLSSLYAGHFEGGRGLFIGRRDAALPRAWSISRTPGCVEAWAGRVYAVVDLARSIPVPA